MISNGTIDLSIISGKHIFWDIDGTIAPCRWDGSPLKDANECTFEKYFLTREPSGFMLRVIEKFTELSAIEHHICGHYEPDEEIALKSIWIDRYVPFMKRNIWVHYQDSKALSILRFLDENGINLEDVIFVDDSIAIVREAYKYGIDAYHVSSLFDIFESM